MHIICNETEYSDFKEWLSEIKEDTGIFSVLPKDTTIVICSDETEKALMRMRVDINGNFTLEEDFVERDREWKEGEEDEFIEKQTRESVIKFFVDRNHDDYPYRQHETMSGLEYEYFNHVHHIGSYTVLVNDEVYNSFSVSVTKEDDLDSVKNEVMEILTAQKEKHGIMDDYHHYFDISDYECSEFDSYKLIEEKPDLWTVHATRSNRELERGTLDKCLEYIQKYRYSEY